jgi:hypothetical protein
MKNTTTIERLKSLLSRKFIIAIVALAFAFSLVLTGHLPIADFMTFAKWIVGLFIAGNVAQKFSNK